MRRGLVLVMAVATGLSVASNYYAQPLLPAIGRTLHMAAGTTGLIVTAAQIGYAIGLVLLLPLGDLLERRALVSRLAIATGLALFLLGAAPSAPVLLPAAFVVGFLSVLAQILVPFAASLASDEERGRVVGLVMSGLLIGVLLARTVAGLLAETGTWRAVYFVSGGAMLLEAVVLRRQLPEWRNPDAGSGYRRMLSSVPTLLRKEPVLRLRSIYGLLSFGAFSVLWTSIALLLADRYHYSSGVIGLFGLAGAGGATAASVAGRLSDRGLANPVTGASSALMLGAWAALWAGGSSLFALVVGIVALDVAAQGVHITNQGEIYRLRPDARSRLTSAYMFLYFVGGASGSVLATTVYSAAGWGGVCAVGSGFAGASVVLWLMVAVRSRSRGRAIVMRP